MKQYKPSNELAEILLKNGFIETTNSFKKSNNANKCNPISDYRYFSLIKKTRGIVFKNDMFTFYNGQNPLETIYDSLNRSELISVIAFYKLPHQTRAALTASPLIRKIRFSFKITEMQSFYNDYKNLSKYKSLTDLIEKAISTVII